MHPDRREAVRQRGGPVQEDPSSALSPSLRSVPLTVAAVARQLGVAPSTLRTWDRRYGVGPSEHTAGSHRRYSPADVARLVLMRRLTVRGVPPGEAARIAKQPSDPAIRAEVTWPDTTDDGGLQVRVEAASDIVAAPPARVGGGRVVALPGAEACVRGLARAAMTLDPHECQRQLTTAVRDRGVVHTWQELAVPVLVALGRRWQSTGEAVEVEHLFSEALVAVFGGVSSALAQPSNERPVLLACVPGEDHSLPLHALSAALAERGIGVRMFGIGLPQPDLVAAIQRCGPSGVVVHAQMPSRHAEMFVELRRQRPAPRLIASGPGWDGSALPSFVQQVGTFGAALDEAVRAVRLS